MSLGRNADSSHGRTRKFTTFAAALLACFTATGLGLALGADTLASTEENDAGLSSEALRAPPQDSPGVELIAERTATSETARLPNDSLETRIYEAPIHYRDENDQWKPIQEDLRQVGGSALSNGANSFDLDLPSRMGADPVRLSIEDEWIAYELLGPATEQVKTEDNVATYEAAVPGVTFELSSLATGLKEDIEISDPSAPSTFVFELSASEGVAPMVGDSGSIEFRAGDRLIALLPAPSISDATAGAPQVADAVRYVLEPRDQGRWHLTVEVDRDWLAQPHRAWPVRIDPTLVVSTPNLDCTYGGKTGQSGWGACGSSGKQELLAAYTPAISGADEWSRSLVRFSLTAIPSNAYIEKATLGLHAPIAAQSTSGIEARRTTKTWFKEVNWRRYAVNEDGGADLLWSQEGGDSTSEGTTVLTSERGSQAGWWNFSGGLTALVRRWVTKAILNQGLLIKLQDDKSKVCGSSSCTKRFVEFNSSASPDSSKRPYLSVNYYLAAPSGSRVTSPTEGIQTARRLKLKAGWTAAGTTGVSFQYRVGNTGPFETIPPELLQDAQGQQVSGPIAVQGNQSEPLYFDARNAPGMFPNDDGNERRFQVRALFEGAIGAAGYSTPVNATVDPAIGGTRDATASLGPGTVNLLTGNLTINRTDVSIPAFGSSLEFSRTHNSRDVGTAYQGGVLGQGWKPGMLVEAAGGAAWQKVREVIASAAEKEEGLGDYALLTDLEGYEYAFELVAGAYVSPPEASGWVLTRLDATRLALTDVDGNRTIFEKDASGTDYLPVSVSQPGASANATRMVYQLVNGMRRLSMIIAPSPAGVSCTETTATTTLGCRALSFSYLPATTWGAPSNMGDRLSIVRYHGPSSASAMSQWEVSKYAYDSQGRMVAQWDPRIVPALKESYTYEGGLIKTLTPPGEEPWTLDYNGSQVEFGRLLTIKRPSLLSSPSVAQTTIAYGVPVSGSGAPYDLSGSTVAQWGQQDIPTDATAIFPPDQIPASPPTSYSRATVHYIDAEGMLVNTSTPSGAGTSAPSISTTETDEHGNVVRELSAQNRLRALAAGASSVARSHELETKRVFNADGTEMQEEWGPLHEVRLESGSIAQARMHRTVQYDEGAPTPAAGTPWPHLPTRETVGASIAGQGVDADQRVTETKYNWTLRKPTDAIVDPLGLNLRTHVEYDAVSGLPTERRLPANPNGGDARTTKILYYTAGAHPSDSSCGNRAAWANLPCKVGPAAQPGTAGQPDLVIEKFASYSALGQPTEVLESPGGNASNVRKTILTYDTAGRQKTWRQEGGGTAIPGTETLYSSTTGRPLAQRFTCTVACESFDDQALTTTYDTLGRPIAYQDADGNTSTTTYDLLSRPASTNDGKGTQTFGYDPTSGLLVSLTDSAAGTFTASYDADGNLVEQGLPNGLAAQTTYDETGSPVHLRYEKMTNCLVECTWLEFNVEESVHGQWLTHTSTMSSQQYSYDKAGRLILVKDTSQAGSCTTRSYSYDANSNRKSLVTRQPGIGGVCDTSSAGTVQSYSYDAADRLIDTGIAYDDFGRITSLPSVYSGGGTLTSSYYSNDLVRSQTQGGITNTYELDAALRQRQRIRSGTQTGTEIYHYTGASDSPAWIDRGTGWSRNIVGIDGGLAATQDSNGQILLGLINLHGDVVGAASLNAAATKPIAKFEFDEFGNPKSSVESKWGWLGSKQRRTELPSGVIQMGVRSYVPALGRFLSPDPIIGGSANLYDYAAGDPVNGFDLDGMRVRRRGGVAVSGARVVRAVRVARISLPVSIIPNPAPSIAEKALDIWNDIKGHVGEIAAGLASRIGPSASAVFERAFRYAINAASGGARTAASVVGWVSREFSTRIPQLTACGTAAYREALRYPGHWAARASAAAVACRAAWRATYR